MATKNEAPVLMAILPGSILKEELRERKISQKEFAKRIEMQESHLSEIINGKRSINKQLADKLENELGIPSIDWMNFQIKFEYDSRQSEERDVIETSANESYKEYDKIFNVKTLIARLDFHSTQYSEIVLFLTRTLKLPEPARLMIQTRGLFKKSDKVGKDTRMIMTWILLAKHFAYTSSLSKLGVYDESKLHELIPLISEIIHSNKNTIERLKETFANYGILFGVVKKVDGAAIDGYSFEYEGRPCIVATTRYDRIDNLAFSVMYELAHIINHDNDEFRVNLSDYDHMSHEEKMANAFAANALIPDDEWKRIPKVKPMPSSIQRMITNWAESKGYNKWIALGRISYETGMYMFKNDNLRKIS